MLVNTSASVADFAVDATGTVSPGKVSGLTDLLSTNVPSAPQLSTWLHVWAGLGAQAESQLTLTVQAVAGARQAVLEGELLLRLVQQAVTCRGKQDDVQTVRQQMRELA